MKYFRLLIVLLGCLIIMCSCNIVKKDETFENNVETSSKDMSDIDRPYPYEVNIYDTRGEAVEERKEKLYDTLKYDKSLSIKVKYIQTEGTSEELLYIFESEVGHKYTYPKGNEYSFCRTNEIFDFADNLILNNSEVDCFLCYRGEKPLEGDLYQYGIRCVFSSDDELERQNKYLEEILDDNIPEREKVLSFDEAIFALIDNCESLEIREEILDILRNADKDKIKKVYQSESRHYYKIDNIRVYADSGNGISIYPYTRDNNRDLLYSDKYEPYYGVQFNIAIGTSDIADKNHSIITDIVVFSDGKVKMKYYT